jgi:hypothetical protein
VGRRRRSLGVLSEVLDEVNKRWRSDCYIIRKFRRGWVTTTPEAAASGLRGITFSATAKSQAAAGRRSWACAPQTFSETEFEDLLHVPAEPVLGRLRLPD